MISRHATSSSHLRKGRRMVGQPSPRHAGQAPPAGSDGGGDPLPPPNQRENSSPSTLDGLRFLFDLDFQCFFDFHDFFHKSLHGFHGFQASQDEPEIPFRFFVLLILVRFPHFQIPFRFSDFDLYSLLPQIPA